MRERLEGGLEVQLAHYLPDKHVVVFNKLRRSLHWVSSSSMGIRMRRAALLPVEYGENSWVIVELWLDYF